MIGTVCFVLMVLLAADLHSKLVSSFLASRAGRAARLLGNRTRRLTAATFDEAGELCVQDLSCIVGREENLAAYRVRALRHAGLAESHPRAARAAIMYRVSS